MLMAASHPERRIAPKMLSVRQCPAGTAWRTRRPTPKSTSAAAGHAGGDAAFVQENQSIRVDPAHLFTPERATPRDGGNILLGGVDRLVFKRSPISRNTLQSRPILAFNPNSPRSRDGNCCKLRSGCSSIHSESCRRISSVNLLRGPRGPEDGRAQLPLR
jgi:hypothetical protein